MDKKKIELIIVFTINTREEMAEEILKQANVPYREGMDSSKGKIYFYSTGPKYILTFETKEKKKKFLAEFKNRKEVYEIYEPDWSIQKD
ncbi:MAG: hypothetical protein JST43_04050 [Bacteroidetes bacterium]|nr:hypothetical protein [Bacteroidota bacterium]MBS1541119.1 hypothetical protein [Bacteroidota bacterium]